MNNRFEPGDLVYYQDWGEPLLLIDEVHKNYYTVHILGDLLLETTDVSMLILDENYTISTDIFRD